MRLKRAVCASNSSQGAAVARACTVKRGATIADLVSEFLALMSGSAGAGSVVVEAAVAILASEGLAQVAVSCQHARRSMVGNFHYHKLFVVCPSLLTYTTTAGFGSGWSNCYTANPP